MIIFQKKKKKKKRYIYIYIEKNNQNCPGVPVIHTEY